MEIYLGCVFHEAFVEDSRSECAEGTSSVKANKGGRNRASHLISSPMEVFTAEAQAGNRPFTRLQKSGCGLGWGIENCSNDCFAKLSTGHGLLTS